MENSASRVSRGRTTIGRVAGLGIVALVLAVAVPAGADDHISIERLTLLPSGSQFVSEETHQRVDYLAASWSNVDAIEIRYLRDGLWGDWETIERGHGADGAEVSNERMSDLLWVGGADGYQIRSSRPDTVTVRTSVVSGDEAPPEQTLDILSAGQPPIVARSSWDPAGTCEPRVDPTRIQPTHLIVHHTSASTTANSYASSAVPDIILNYCLYHRDGRGWDDIAYNFLIDRFGTIWEGRAGGIDQGIRGGSSMGANYTSVSVAFIGNHEIASPSASAQAAEVEMLAWLSELHNLDPPGVWPFMSEGSAKLDPGETISLSVISGHKDTQATACPGVFAYAKLASFRLGADAAAGPYTPYDQYASAVEGDFDGDGKLDGALFRRSDGAWVVTSDALASPSTAVWADFSTSSGWTRQIVGDFTGDGNDDIASYHLASGRWWVSESTGTAFVTRLWDDFSTNSGWIGQVVGDFTGDGNDDVANFHPGSGRWWVSQSDGSNFTTRLWSDFSTNSGWTEQLVGDFDGDNLDDIANFHAASGNWWLSPSTGNSFGLTFSATGAMIGQRSWSSVQDATGDGVDDLLVMGRIEGRWDIVGQSPTIDAGYSIYRADLLLSESGGSLAFDTRRNTWMSVSGSASSVSTVDRAAIG